MEGLLAGSNHGLGLPCVLNQAYAFIDAKVLAQWPPSEMSTVPSYHGGKFAHTCNASCRAKAADASVEGSAVAVYGCASWSLVCHAAAANVVPLNRGNNWMFDVDRVQAELLLEWEGLVQGMFLIRHSRYEVSLGQDRICSYVHIACWAVVTLHKLQASS